MPLLPSGPKPIDLQSLYFTPPSPNAAYWLRQTQETAKATPPSVRGMLASAIGKVASPRTANRYADKIVGAAENLTPYGAVAPAQQARTDFKKGNYLGALFNGGMAALSAFPDGGSTVAHSIIAPLFHGSPHAFDKFMLEKIGTGEGAQAYGHGLYFAENPAVARDYQRVLSANRPIIGGGAVRNSSLGDTDEVMAALGRHFAGRDVSIPKAAQRHTFSNDATSLIMEALDESGNDFNGALKYLREKASNEPDRLFSTYVPRAEANDVGAAYAKAAGMLAENPFTQSPGHLYEVSLNANPEDFLNWDARLDQQNPTVLSRLGIDANDMEKQWAALRSAKDQIRAKYPTPTGLSDDELLSALQAPPSADPLYRQRNEAEKALMGMASKWAVRPDATIAEIAKTGDRPGVSQALNALGIPGIRYLDQGSRTAGQGTHNYVVFDPSIIDILNRY